MSVKSEISNLEERLRLAELAPDANVFEELLDDECLMDGQRMKEKIVAAHRPGQGQKFTKVELSDFKIVEQECAAVVTCKCAYEGPQWSGTLRFQRVWVKKSSGWKIVAVSTLK